MKSKKSAVEIKMKDMIILCDDIIDDSYLTTKDARKIVDLLGKGLGKIEELRISRDKKVSRLELRQLMTKAFKTGQDKANDYPAKLWVEEEIHKLK